MPSAMLVLSVCDVLVTLKNLIKGSISKDGNWIDAPLSSIINYLLLQVGKLSFTKITPNFPNIFWLGLAFIWPKDTAIALRWWCYTRVRRMFGAVWGEGWRGQYISEIMWWPVPGVRYISLATRDMSPWPPIGQSGAWLASDWLKLSPGVSYQWQSLHHKTITLLHILMVTKTQQMVRCHPGLTRLQTPEKAHNQKMQCSDKHKIFSLATSVYPIFIRHGLWKWCENTETRDHTETSLGLEHCLRVIIIWSVYLIKHMNYFEKQYPSFPRERNKEHWDAPEVMEVEGR